MNESTPYELKGRELDAEIACLAFGWRWEKWESHAGCGIKRAALVPPESSGLTRWNYPTGQTEPATRSDPRWADCMTGVAQVPHFSTDHAAAWELECEIERRGLLVQYVTALSHIVDDANGPRALWVLIHATAEQRARAALVALVPPEDVKPPRSVCQECNGLGEWLDTPSAPEPCSACGATGVLWACGTATATATSAAAAAR